MKAPGSHHRRSGSNSDVSLLNTEGEATAAPDDPQEDVEIHEILSRQNAPPEIVLSLTPEDTTGMSSAQPAGGNGAAPPSTPSIEVVVMSSPPKRDDRVEAPALTSPRGRSFDKRFPLLLCVSCTCCTLLAFVLVALWGGARGLRVR